MKTLDNGFMGSIIAGCERLADAEKDSFVLCGLKIERSIVQKFVSIYTELVLRDSNISLLKLIRPLLERGILPGVKEREGLNCQTGKETPLVTTDSTIGLKNNWENKKCVNFANRPTRKFTNGRTRVASIDAIYPIGNAYA